MSFPSRFALWLLIHRRSLPLSFASGSRMHDGPRGFAFNNIPMHRIRESHQAILAFELSRASPSGARGTLCLESLVGPISAEPTSSGNALLGDALL